MTKALVHDEASPRSERPLRVFLGTDDVAFCLSGMAAGFRRRGHAVTAMVEAKSRFAGDLQYDVVRGRELIKRFDYNRAPRLVASAAYRLDTGPVRYAVNAASTPEYLRHDVFLFFRATWLPEPLLLPLLKRAGKAVAFFLLGSEVRHISAFSQEFGVDTSKWRREFQVDPLDAKVRWLRHVELHSDLVYSVPDQAGLQIRPYMHAHIPLDVLDSIVPNIPARRSPLVVHAPSRDDVKGTSLVLRAAEELRAAGVKFELRVLSGVARQEVLAARSEADVLVDELFLHGPGTLAAEAMASGCAVATRTLETNRHLFNPPVCSVRPENLVAQWRRLVEDVDYRVDLARRGREWALREYAPTEIAARVEQHLSTPPAPDYVPDFYLSRYRLPDGMALSPRAKALSSEVARRFRPESHASIRDAARRGLLMDR
jgi:hypothetical protein